MDAKHFNVKKLLKKFPNAILIKSWDELRAIPNISKTHTLEVNEYSGSLTPNGEFNWKNYHYLSTHTFYGMRNGNGYNSFVDSTFTLQKCGFNVVIDNWDKEDNNET
jgi:hypothetical protein